MLKELWRKLGADLLQADSPYDECRDIAPEGYGSADFRILPHITHTGEFHLERLTALLKSRYGKSSEAESALSDDAIRDLIVFAARIQDRSEERRVGKECRSRWAPDD